MSDNTMANTQPVDITQQVTSQIPITQPIVKNPKRVAAGKRIAEKRKQAREEQKKKLAEAEAIMAKEELRIVEEKARKAEAVLDPPVEMEAPVATPAAAESQTLTTTQWLSIASIIVSLVAIYYKREEIKGAVAKIKLAKAPAKEPVLAAPKKKKGIRSMD